MGEKAIVSWTSQQIKKEAAAKLRGNWLPVNLVILISFAILKIIGTLSGLISEIVFRNFFLVSLLITSAISALINGSFSMGIHNSALNIAKNIKPRVSDINIGFNPMKRAISLQIVYQIISFGFAIIIGVLTYLFYGYYASIISRDIINIAGNTFLFILCIAPFVVVLIIALSKLAMSWFVMIENPDMKLNDIVDRSLDVMKGNEWKLISMVLSFIGWILLAALGISLFEFILEPLFGYGVFNFLGFFCSIPLYSYIYVAMAQFYLCATGREEIYSPENNL